MFCSILNYAVDFNRSHLYDYNQSKEDIARFKRTDISLVNTQPSSNFRAHFEVYVGTRLFRTLPGPLNLWSACMWVYAAIYKVHRGKYGTYVC